MQQTSAYILTLFVKLYLLVPSGESDILHPRIVYIGVDIRKSYSNNLDNSNENQ